jgi:hypothetical protein
MHLATTVLEGKGTGLAGMRLNSHTASTSGQAGIAFETLAVQLAGLTIVKRIQPKGKVCEICRKSWLRDRAIHRQAKQSEFEVDENPTPTPTLLAPAAR